MPNKSFLTLFALAFAVMPLGAQQEGSVAIAESIRPTEEATLADFTKCAADLKALGMKPKDAAKDCKEMVKVAAHTTTRVANEAADATKASKPTIMFSGYGGGYYGRSYSYRRPIVIHSAPARRAPVRIAPSPNQAKPRPTVASRLSTRNRVATARRVSASSLRSR